MPKSDEGRVGLVPNEEPPATSSNSAQPAAVPVLYYTASGGRANAEVVIVTNSIGGQRVLSPQSTRPEDFNPKRSPVTAERLARLRCLTILALLLAPPVGLLALLALLLCRRAFHQLGGGADETTRWARRLECLFIAALLFSVAELVIALLLLQYYMHGGF